MANIVTLPKFIGSIDIVQSNENLIDHLKNKGVDTITTKSAGEGAVKMHQMEHPKQ